MLLASAQKLLARLGPPTPPTHGTGPEGARQNDGTLARWITLIDVLKHCAALPIERGPTWTKTTRGTTPLPRVTLQPHQVEAVAASMPEEATFRSGLHEIRCGGGKTFVGGELVRRAQPETCVVVTQHNVSVDQWVAHLEHVLGGGSGGGGGGGGGGVVTLETARGWKVHHPLPRVVVLTYHALTRAATQLAHHGGGDEHANAPWLLWMLHCQPFGLLVLDECHVAAADQFRAACRLRAGAVFGLSGSLVREDSHLGRLATLVGPVLYQHMNDAEQRVVYEVVRVPLDAEVLAQLQACENRRSVGAQALRALNPPKLAALARILPRHERVLLFCDSPLAATLLADHLGAPVLHGGVEDAERARLLRAFAASTPAVLVSTRVCDAAVDFPPGCVVVQLGHTSGSRQQEVQRCGRGAREDHARGPHAWRGEARRGEARRGETRVIHVVNRGTEEEGFVARRVAHMRTIAPTLQETTTDDDGPVDAVRDRACLRALTTVSLEAPAARRADPHAKWRRALAGRKRPR